MRRVALLPLLCVFPLLAACGGSKTESGSAGAPATGAKAKELIVGVWEQTDKGGIAWETLSPSLKAPKALAIEFQKNGSAVLFPNGPNDFGDAGTFTLADDGSLEFVNQIIIVGGGGTPPPPTKLKVKAEVRENQLTLSDGSKTEKFKRGKAPEPGTKTFGPPQKIKVE
jgi:hypothetical protein